MPSPAPQPPAAGAAAAPPAGGRRAVLPSTASGASGTPTAAPAAPAAPAAAAPAAAPGGGAAEASDTESEDMFCASRPMDAAATAERRKERLAGFSKKGGLRRAELCLIMAMCGYWVFSVLFALCSIIS